MSHHQILITTYLNAKDPYKGKYQSRIHKGEDKGLNHLNDSKAWYSNDMDDTYADIKE